MKTIFKSSWLDAISCCGKDLQLKIIRAAIHYQETGSLPEQMTPSVRLALRLILAFTDTCTDPQAESSTTETNDVPLSDSIEAQDADEENSDEESSDEERADEAGSDEPEETAADRAAMARALNMLRYPRAGKARKGGKKFSRAKR